MRDTTTKKPNRLAMRKSKGWIGFVRSYNNYIKNGSYDKMKWGDRTQEPKDVTTDKMGKTIYKW